MAGCFFAAFHECRVQKEIVAGPRGQNAVPDGMLGDVFISLDLVFVSGCFLVWEQISVFCDDFPEFFFFIVYLAGICITRLR